MTRLDDIDVTFGWNGDLDKGSDGDIKINSDRTLQSLLDQIHSICASSLGDWEVYPGRGAGLDDFIGEPNTRFTSELLQERVRLALTSAEVVSDQDLEIKLIPVHIHKVLIILLINAEANAFNKITTGERLQVSIVFDSVERSVFFIDKTPLLIGG